MAEPETQTEDETMTSITSNTSEVLRKVKTDTDVTEDATIKSSDKKASKRPESETSEGGPWKERSWTDKGWNRGVKSYAGSPLKNDGRKTAASNVARSPGAEDIERPFPLRECFPLGGFQLERRARTAVGLDRRRRTRIWRSMKARQPTRIFRTTGRTSRIKSFWPSLTRDAAIGLKAREKEGRKRRRDVFPCDPSDDDEDEFRLRERRSDLANRKELGYVRVPVTRPDSRKLMVERAVGERPGLVDGDYVIVELPANRVYANVVLRGLKGMHLLEMSSLRERKNTWKFCFYQAVVALLAKTQLRYKYAWSANIDYIYDHAWMLYTHIGTINVKPKQRLDDVVVYNYKYSVEIELIQEMKDIVTRCIDDDYKENGVRQFALSRKDPLQVRAEVGCQKVTDSGYVSVHDDVKELEEWLGKLTAGYRDCLLRTTRFSLAFWQDGLFWYLYNPYRCDGYGFWDDNGHACIVKFCSTDSLRRHLMILLLRGYHAYEISHSRNESLSEIEDDKNSRLDVQIFHVSFRCCELDNPKLLQRGVSKQPRRVDCPSLEIEDQEDETDPEEDEEGDPKEPREKAAWLRRCRTATWGKCASQPRRRSDSAEVTVATKTRWHQYYVEEPNRLFSLWGEVHPTDDMFDEANRGMQAYACYVVCAGMTMITAPEYWSPKTLDAIVMCGDRYYTRSRREAELKSGGHAGHPFRYLSDRFEIGEILLEARMLPAVHGRLYVKSSECLWRTLERVFSSYHFAALTCESACLGLFKFCGAYYMCDVNSFGPPLFSYGRGAAYLLRATSFRKFMTVLVLTIGSSERSRFSLNPIEILKIVEVDTPESRAKTRERGRRFGKFVEKIPGKLLKFASDEQKKRRTKK